MSSEKVEAMVVVGAVVDSGEAAQKIEREYKINRYVSSGIAETASPAKVGRQRYNSEFGHIL